MERGLWLRLEKGAFRVFFARDGGGGGVVREET